MKRGLLFLSTSWMYGLQSKLIEFFVKMREKRLDMRKVCGYNTACVSGRHAEK